MQTNNSVTLIQYSPYGDWSHCLAAWASTGTESNIPLEHSNTKLKDLYEATVINKKKSPKQLLEFLADAGHHTPFEQSFLQFQVTGDIASHIHQLKHRISSVNTESARYKELVDKWYIPEDWNDKKVYIKGIKLPFTWANVLNWFSKLGTLLYHTSANQLTPFLGRKRAKETSRYFLGYNKQLNYYVCFNFRSFMHFQKLRNSKHTQKEILTIAKLMLEEVRKTEVFNDSLEAFKY